MDTDDKADRDNKLTIIEDIILEEIGVFHELGNEGEIICISERLAEKVLGLFE